MQNRPPYTGHSGNCVVNAVANVLHYHASDEDVKNLKQKIRDDYESIHEKNYGYGGSGLLFSEISHIIDNLVYTSFEAVRFAPLYFSRSTPLTSEQLNKEYDFAGIAEMNADLVDDLFFQLIAFIETDKGSQHCISMYLSLDNLALIVMDSAWPGTMELIELAQLCTKYKVMGLGMLVNETIEGYEPFFVEKAQLKIF